MKLLVIGKEGQLAQSIAERAGEGHEIYRSCREEFDLFRPEELKPLIDRIEPDAIINASAYTAVDKAETERETAHALNAIAPAKMAEIAAGYQLPFIHFSTDYVFSGTGENAFTEDDATAPVNYYGETKLAGEKGVLDAHNDALIIRTSWVYSPFGNNFVKTMLRLAADRDLLTVVGDQWGCATCALDLADATLAAIRHYEKNGSFGANLAHFAGHGETNWAEFAQYIFEMSAQNDGPSAQVKAITTAEYPTDAKRPENSRLNSDLFTQHFGQKSPHWKIATQQVVTRIV